MKRRSFLKTAAALFPAAGLESSAGQTPAPSPSDQPHVIAAGEDRLGESHSRGYSSILFKVLPRETSNGMFVIEHLNLIKGGPPLHLHLQQEEYFYVIEGEVHFQIGDSRKPPHAGRLHTRSARRSAHFRSDWRNTRAPFDRLHPSRRHGTVPSRHRHSKPAESRRGFLSSIRHGTSRSSPFATERLKTPGKN